jgi:hypothetical protein
MKLTQGQPWYVRVRKEVSAHSAVGGRCKGLKEMFRILRGISFQ